MTKSPKPAPDTPLAKIQAAAEIYGMRSFDNYVQIRSVAEQIRDGLCEFLDNGQKCVYLVPWMSTQSSILTFRLISVI